jgi:hypothetical protein
LASTAFTLGLCMLLADFRPLTATLLTLGRLPAMQQP